MDPLLVRDKHHRDDLFRKCPLLFKIVEEVRLINWLAFRLRQPAGIELHDNCVGILAAHRSIMQ